MGKIEGKAQPILCIVGARPNYMKMAPLISALSARKDMPAALLVHTGQHYDAFMNDQLFRDLQLPVPDVNLEVGSGTHAVQTAEIMKRFEPIIDAHQPSCVVVVGDVNSTIACGLVAVKKYVPLVHVEAGLRSNDRRMPEEINRVLTDQISDLLYTTERAAHDNLAREGIDDDRVQFVGNLMIDSLIAHKPRAVPARVSLAQAGVPAEKLDTWAKFGIVTLHRPSNVDSSEVLGDLVQTVVDASRRLPLVWPLHPRTRANMDRFGLSACLQSDRILAVQPLGYLQMLGLMSEATIVLTDSGGIQEETTALGVPCLTLRENTERPITIEQGTNTLVGTDRDMILSELDTVLGTGGKRGRVPELWDGRAATRIAEHLAGWMSRRVIQ